MDNQQTTAESITPNFFDYATSEASQDALICWLSAWADKKYQTLNPELYQCATQFITTLLTLSREKIAADFVVEHLTVKKQWQKVDVLIEVNHQYIILIEDKKATKEHSNQLARYKSVIQKSDYKKHKLICVYFKMQNQGRLGNITANGYHFFNRRMMLDILSPYIDKTQQKAHPIAKDFYRYINAIEEKICSYRRLPVDAWNGWSWDGFFTELHETMGNTIGSVWGYVPTPSGGFKAFTWHWQNSPNKKWGEGASYQGKTFGAYLQLEQDKLVIKLIANEVEKSAEQSYLRRAFQQCIYQVIAAEYPELKGQIKNHGRRGATMSVVCFSAYRQTNNDNIIDISRTIDVLKQFEVIFDKAFALLKQRLAV